MESNLLGAIIDQSDETKLVAPSIEKSPTAVSFCAQSIGIEDTAAVARGAKYLCARCAPGFVYNQTIFDLYCG